MNILVTGGAGFIGSHVCDTLLDKGYNVICIDVISKFMRNSHLISSGHSKNSRGSVVSPLTTEAANVAGEQR